MFEIGVDECARGPMFGRLYTAAVVLPKQDFDFSNMKDGKKIKSRKKMREISDYIKSNAIAWSIQYIEPEEIDKINIRQSVLKSMRASIVDVIQQLQLCKSDVESQTLTIVDGNDFPTYCFALNDETVKLPHICVEKADNTYCFVAAASILAKCAHDEYIVELCEKYPSYKSATRFATMSVMAPKNIWKGFNPMELHKGIVLLTVAAKPPLNISWKTKSLKHLLYSVQFDIPKFCGVIHHRISDQKMIILSHKT